MAQFYLSANNYRKDKLNWFGTQEGTFKVAIAGDGTPFGKDDRALAWLVSFRTHRFSVTLSFTPKHSSDRKKVPSDELYTQLCYHSIEHFMPRQTLPPHLYIYIYICYRYIQRLQKIIYYFNFSLISTSALNIIMKSLQ